MAYVWGNSKKVEYEVAWGMTYNTHTPEEAVRQALAELVELPKNPQVGPRVFLVRRTSDKNRQWTPFTVEEALNVERFIPIDQMKTLNTEGEQA